MTLSLFFQQTNTDIGKVKVKVDSCIRDLEMMRDDTVEDDKPTYYSLLEEHLQEGVFKKQHTVARNAAHFHSVKTNFLQAMIDNMKTRFPEDSLMFKFSALGMQKINFIPDNDLDTWRNEDVQAIADFYTSPQKHKGPTGEVFQSEPFLDCSTADILKEWMEVKRLVKREQYPTSSLSTLWMAIASDQEEGDSLCPNLSKLACLAVTHPVHTSDCERAFSVQNLTVTPLRNRLSAERCDQLMRVKIEGGPMDRFDFAAAISKWSNPKRRIKLN
jgi:hypothetical protein